MRRLVAASLVVGLALTGSPSNGARAAAAGAQQTTAPAIDAGLAALLVKLDQVIRAGDPAAYMPLLTPLADWARAESFATAFVRPGATRSVVRERNRYALPGSPPGAAYRLLIDAFIEHGPRGRADTWLIDVERGVDNEWRIVDQVPVSSVDRLVKLALDGTQQFRARDFIVRAEDLTLTLADGIVFTVTTGDEVTGLVLVGRGDIHFQPGPDAERGQVRIYSGSEALESRFDAAYIRTESLDGHADLDTLTTVPVNQAELRRAESVFRDESAKAYTLDLGDLSRDRWSAPAAAGEFLAEVRTRRFGTLTYARSPSDPEDISVFDRRSEQYISLYASRETIAARGPYHDEDARVPYDVVDYDLDVSYVPLGTLLDARARLRVRIKESTTQLTLRLADALAVHSVTSDEFGRLFTVRAPGHLLVVNLPEKLDVDQEIALTIVYSGSLQTQGMPREALEQQPTLEQELQRSSELSQRQLNVRFREIRYLYSGQVYWYPQSLVSDYATGRLRLTLPDDMECVATGELSRDSPIRVPELPDQRQYLYTAERPVRYFAFLATRFIQTDRLTVAFDSSGSGDQASTLAPAGAGTSAFPSYHTLDVTIAANPRLVPHAERLGDRTADIALFYHSLIGDLPYKSLSIGLVETTNYEGHAPPYLAIVGKPVPGQSTTPPAANVINFAQHPEFVLAHEVAHQWWGQAVGWRNYHEQWLSEGFAQYFALLFVRHDRGENAFADAMRQMRRSAMDASDEGPMYLGYRLGQVRNNRQVFRAIVYNKGSAVLHMLRRLLGEETFMRGLRHYYTSSRFTKAGTEDFRRALEVASGQSLERFFARWVYGSTLPDIRFSYRVETADTAPTAVLRFEQRGDIFDLPVTLTLQYADRRNVDVTVPITDRIVETRVPLDGTLRTIVVRDDDGTLADIRR